MPQELVPGVKILSLGAGHSYGMLALAVEPEQGKNAVLASDSIYCKGNLEPELCEQGILVDRDGYFRTIQYLIKYAADTDSVLWFGHDMEQFLRLREDSSYGF